jgi:hypothetical protein
MEILPIYSASYIGECRECLWDVTDAAPQESHTSGKRRSIGVEDS